MKPLFFKSILIISLLTLVLFVRQPPASRQAATGTFTFTAVGDYAATTNTSAVLDAIAVSAAHFPLALGDLESRVIAVRWSLISSRC